MSFNERNDTESQWLRYVDSLEYFDALAVDASARVELVDRLSPVLFSKTTQLRLLELSDSSEILKSTIESEEGMNAFSDRHSNAQVEIISISQETSVSPLNISKSSLFKLLQHYQVSPDFFDVVCGFGDKKLSSDESCVTGPYNTLDGSVYEISYQISYMERKHSRGNPWTLRQSGVYHKYSRSAAHNPKNTWIIIHPRPNSKLYQRFEKASSAEIGVGKMRENSLRLHLFLFSSYLDNWRHYFHDMTRECLDLQDRLMTSELHDGEEYTALNFETLQTLRHMAGKLIPIPTILEASLKTIAAIKTMNSIMSSQPEMSSSPAASRELFKTSSQLSAFEVRLQSYLATCLVLQARIENLTKFLADGLNLKNQEVAVKSNGHLVTLTKDTINDNATVRAVTLVTLIYLPATFMSGLFGSNLFAFSSDTWNFEMSPQIWIYFVATIPLTVVTLGYWKYKTNQQRKKKKKEEEVEELKRGMQSV